MLFTAQPPRAGRHARSPPDDGRGLVIYKPLKHRAQFPPLFFVEIMIGVARHWISFSTAREYDRVDRVYVLLRPPIPGGVDEVGLSPDPYGRVILVAAETDEVNGWPNRREHKAIRIPVSTASINRHSLSTPTKRREESYDS